MQPTPRQISHDLQMHVEGQFSFDFFVESDWYVCILGHLTGFAGESVPFLTPTFLLLCYPVSHTKTVFRCTHKEVGLFHRLWTPSRWPVVSLHTFVTASTTPSISSSFKRNSACSLLTRTWFHHLSLQYPWGLEYSKFFSVSIVLPLDKDEYMNHSRLQLTGIARHVLRLMKLIN